jgi:hypothetical protein
MKVVLFALLLAVGLTQSPAFGGTVGWEFTSVGLSANNGNYTLGEIFTPTQAITVDALGYYDNGCADCLRTDHLVGIFDATGTLLGSTTITASSTDVGHFAYNPVGPIDLIAGQTYVLEGVSGTVDLYVYNDPGFTASALITISGFNYFLDSGALDFNGITPAADPKTDAYWGPNFEFDGTTTPEPGSLTLIGTGLLCLGGIVRRKLS